MQLTCANTPSNDEVAEMPAIYGVHMPKAPMNSAAIHLKMEIVRAGKKLPPDEIAALRARFELAMAQSLIDAGEQRIRELTGERSP